MSEDGGVVWTRFIKSDASNNFFNVRSLVIDPADPEKLWAAGEYEHDSNTVMAVASATPASQQWDLIEMPTSGTSEGYLYDIAVSPSNSDVRWASGYFLYQYQYMPGLYKSVDGGQTWSDVSSAAWSVGHPIRSVAIDPADPDVVYIAGSLGVFRTDDGGASWGYAGCQNAMKVLVDPTEPNIVWAGTKNEGVGLSRDGGSSWEFSSGELLSLQVLDVDVNPQRPWVVYASTEGGGVYRALLDDHPSPVHLTLVEAVRDGIAVLLQWELQDDGQQASFNVYREEADGVRVRISAEPVLGYGVFQFRDEAAPFTETLYWLEEASAGGDPVWYGPLVVPPLPLAGLLDQNYPNPFNPSTRIRFTLASPSPVRLSVFDLAGRLVRTLVDGRPHPAGRHDVVWDGLDDQARAMGSGIYICTLQTESGRDSRRMTLVR